MKTTIFTYLLVCKGLSNDDVGGAGGTIFQEIHGRERGSKPAISLKKNVGGATVERLDHTFSVSDKCLRLMKRCTNNCIISLNEGKNH